MQSNEQGLIKFYESVKTELETHGFVIDVTYRSFDIKKDDKIVGSCSSIDGLKSWLAAYMYVVFDNQK